MNKKNILVYLFMMLPALLLTSCLKDQEDLFDKSASDRVQTRLDEAKAALVGAPYGWVLNMYPDGEQSYGGYAFTLEFDDQNVTAATELAADVAQTFTSTYILNNESGPVLMFDTYNPFLHFFSTPSGSSGAGGYEAYGGDNQFMITDVAKDGNTISLKGARSGNVMKMTKLTMPAQDYLAAVNATYNDMSFSKFVCTTDENVVLNADADGRWMDISNVAVAEDPDYVESAFAIVPGGIELYQPIEYKGQTISKLNYSFEEATMTTEDGKLVFKAVIPPIMEGLLDGTSWYLCKDNLCSSMQALWTTAATNLKNSEDETLGTVEFTGDLLFMTSGNYGCSWAVTSEVLSETQVKFSHEAGGPNSTYSGNAGWYDQNVKGFTAFHSMFTGTYNIEYADDRRASIKLTNVDDPNSWFIVTKSSKTPY